MLLLSYQFIFCYIFYFIVFFYFFELKYGHLKNNIPLVLGSGVVFGYVLLPKIINKQIENDMTNYVNEFNSKKDTFINQIKKDIKTVINIPDY